MYDIKTNITERKVANMKWRILAMVSDNVYWEKLFARLDIVTSNDAFKAKALRREALLYIALSFIPRSVGDLSSN